MKYIVSGEKVLLRKIKSRNVSLKKGLPTFVSPMKGAGSLDYNLQFWANTNYICWFVESIWLVTKNLTPYPFKLRRVKKVWTTLIPHSF